MPNSDVLREFLNSIPRQHRHPGPDGDRDPDRFEQLLPGYLVVPKRRPEDSSEEAIEELVERIKSRVGEEIQVETGAEDLIEDHFGRDHALDEHDRSLLEYFKEQLTFVKLTDGASKLAPRKIGELARDLRMGDRLDVQPMFAMFGFNHWDAQPGKDPEDIPETRQNAASGAARRHSRRAFGVTGWPVYVIDDGYNTNNLWDDFIGEKVVGDRVTTGAPHGTAVTGLIAALSPGSTIHVLKTDYSDLRPPSEEQPISELSVSLRFLKAILLYINSSKGREPAVISLPLGTYEFNIDDEGEPAKVKKLVPLTLEFQLELLEHLPLLRVVAAGGNDRGHGPHVLGQGEESAVAYPASDRRVIGVGAGETLMADDELL